MSYNKEDYFYHNNEEHFSDDDIKSIVASRNSKIIVDFYHQRIENDIHVKNVLHLEEIPDTQNILLNILEDIKEYSDSQGVSLFDQGSLLDLQDFLNI